jgi:putative peptidoglycan lipid II flippase
LHQAAYILAGFALASQALALVRDRLLAHHFGAGVELDLYYAAFRIPDVLYVLFASMLSVYVLIPFVSSRMHGDDHTAARAFLSKILTLFIVSYAVLAVVVAIFAPQIVAVAFPGFSVHADELALLIRIFLLQPLLLGISSLFGVVTQLEHRFVLYAISPLIYNAGIILGLVAFYPFLGLSGLALGVVVGAFGHAAVQLPLVARGTLAPYISFDFSRADIMSVLSTSVPRALTLSLHQLALLGLVGFASVMTSGSVSVFQFAFNLQSVPLAVIGVSYSVAAFPMLARLYAAGERSAFSAHIMTALRHIVFWSVPVLVLLIVIRAQFVRVILGSGAFDWDDTRLTAATLALFSVSLVAQAVNLLIVRALYAAGNTRIALYVTLGSATGILCLSFGLFEWYRVSPAFQYGIEALMRVEHVPGTEVLVLALGYTTGLIFHSVILTALAADRLALPLRKLTGYVIRACIAGLCGGLAAYVTLNFIVGGLRTETLLGIFLQGAAAGTCGVIAVIWAYYMQGSEELREIYRSFHRRIFKTDIVAPQDEDHLAV